MKPIGKYIAIKKVKEEITTKSGLLLSGDDVDGIRYKKATVAESGTDVTVINKGDTIYYDSRTGYTMFIEDEQFTIIQEHDVVVVV
jgi:co-chaperonin GroES (HSP10)